MSLPKESRYTHLHDYLVFNVFADIPGGAGLQQKIEIRVTKECLLMLGSDGIKNGNNKALFENETAIIAKAWAHNVTNESSSVTLSTQDFL